MAGLVAAIHAFVHQPVDAWHKAGHDWLESCRRWHDVPGQARPLLHGTPRLESGRAQDPKQSQTEILEEAMVQQLGIRLCLDRAGECERLAELAGDPRSKQTYLHIANQWRALAAHREFVEQIDSLLAASGGSDPLPGSAPG